MPKERRESQTIIRTVKNKDNPYAVIHKGVFTDTRLSWKAKGLMAYLLSRPDDWRVYVSDLIHRSTDGRDSVYAGLLELKRTGYIVEKVYRATHGYILSREYVVYESPMSLDPEKPEQDATLLDPDFPDQAKPDQVNPPLLNKDHTEYRTTTCVVDEPLVKQLADFFSRSEASALVASHAEQSQRVLTYWAHLSDNDRQRIKNPAGWVRDAILKGYQWAQDLPTAHPEAVVTAVVFCPSCRWEVAIAGEPAEMYRCPYCDVDVPFDDHHRPWA